MPSQLSLTSPFYTPKLLLTAAVSSSVSDDSCAGERREGFIMKVVRTRIAVTLASSAVLASAFGLTAFAVASASSGTTMLAASQSIAQPCPNGTIIDYCAQR